MSDERENPPARKTIAHVRPYDGTLSSYFVDTQGGRLAYPRIVRGPDVHMSFGIERYLGKRARLWLRSVR